MTHRPGKAQRAILRKIADGDVLYRAPGGGWHLAGRAANRSACEGLHTYGYIMQGFAGDAGYVLTEQGKAAVSVRSEIRPREGM